MSWDIALSETEIGDRDLPCQPLGSRMPQTAAEMSASRTIHRSIAPHAVRLSACTRARMRAREKSLKNFRLVPLRRRYVSPLSCRSCRHRSWSGWGGMEQRDGIVDLGAETGMKKHERGSDRLRSGKPNSNGAEHNEATGHRHDALAR
jgi:hypothetical protein